MKIPGGIVAVTLILVGMASAPARAQTLIAGGAVQLGVERFRGDPDFNRLDGSAIGLTVIAGIRLGPLVARIEAWRNAVMEDADTTTLALSGRTVITHSSLSHQAHAVSALGGYAHDVSSRFQVVGVAGISHVTVSRVFATDAGQLLLVRPSSIPSGPTTARTVDRLTAWSLGADGFYRLSDRMRLMAAVRGEPLRLNSDLSGRSVRVLAGAVWTPK